MSFTRVKCNLRISRGFLSHFGHFVLQFSSYLVASLTQVDVTFFYSSHQDQIFRAPVLPGFSVDINGREQVAVICYSVIARWDHLKLCRMPKHANTQIPKTGKKSSNMKQLNKSSKKLTILQCVINPMFTHWFSEWLGIWWFQLK